jgi:tetratricopeptide (TPR) repeat protein
LTALLQKSLVLRRTSDRYDLHPIVRQYAAEKLEAAEETVCTYDQAVAYFQALAAEGEEPNFVRIREPAWMDRIEAEQDNFRAALDWCRAQDRVEAWLRLAATIRIYWDFRGQFDEGLSWLEAAVQRDTELAGEAQPGAATVWGAAASARAKALNGISNLTWRRYDSERTISAAEEALAIFRALEDPWGVAAALNMLGRAVRDDGDLERAKPLLEESLQLYRMLGDARCEAYAIGTLAILAHKQGNSVLGNALTDKSVAICRKLGDGWGCALQLSIVADAAFERGDYSEAISVGEETLALFQEAGFIGGVASSYYRLGKVKRAQGELAGARACFEAHLALQRDMGNTQAIEGTLEVLEELAEQDEQRVLAGAATA